MRISQCPIREIRAGGKSRLTASLDARMTNYHKHFPLHEMWVVAHVNAPRPALERITTNAWRYEGCALTLGA